MLESIIRRGADYFAWADLLEILPGYEGDLSEATCEADLKKAVNGLPPDDDDPIVETFTTTFVAENNAGVPGFHLHLTKEQTEALEPGKYVFDVLITIGSATQRSAFTPCTVPGRVTDRLP